MDGSKLLITLIIRFCWWKQASWCIWTLHFHSPLPIPDPASSNVGISKFENSEISNCWDGFFQLARRLLHTFESVQKRVPETPNWHSVLYQGSTCWESFWQHGKAKNAENGKLINPKIIKNQNLVFWHLHAWNGSQCCFWTLWTAGNPHNFTNLKKNA